jgi:hypothetical protein
MKYPHQIYLRPKISIKLIVWGVFIPNPLLKPLTLILRLSQYLHAGEITKDCQQDTVKYELLTVT